MTQLKKAALITGAAGGVGQEVAALLHRQGYQLWLTDRDADTLQTMQQQYPDARTTTCDLLDSQALEELCQSIESLPGDLSVALINAGIVIPGSVVDTTRQKIAAQLTINMTAAALLNHACATRMSRQDTGPQVGHIINTLSAAAMISLPGSAAYSASKFGLRGFLIALAADLKPHGVAVSGIFPNAIDTPMLRNEAASGGSVLNFLSEPVTARDVAQTVEQALSSRKLEYFVPSGDSFVARLVCSYPRLMTMLYPLLEKRGTKGRDAYLKKYGLTLKT